MIRLLATRISRDADVVVARQRARQVAAALGFDDQDQTRIATAVSELARNVERYAGEGVIEFSLDLDDAMLGVTVSDRGPGIADLPAILDGTYHSATGRGLGIVGARRLMDVFDIQSAPGRGTTVVLRKVLPPGHLSPTSADVARVIEGLAAAAPPPVDEVQQQHQDLVSALEQLREKQEALSRLNAELQDTNRGVLALYAELDEKAEQVRRADEMRSRLLSNMSHEFQTPLGSILALSRLLLERADGELTPEQEKQVRFIREAASELSQLVHDLLDVAKADAGKVGIRASVFTVHDLFGTLRGLMRPLQQHDDVALTFEVPDLFPPLYTDEAKVSQILRNYISNALKFTERGEVRVRAEMEDGNSVVFGVTDTGIGISAADQARLFQEFVQLPNRLQQSVRGTGLGLSLSKRIAEVLGGTVGVDSVPEQGSTFWVRLPLVAPGHRAPAGIPGFSLTAAAVAPAPLVLIIDDDEPSRYVLRRYLAAEGCRVIEASGGAEGLLRVREDRPDAIFLDLRMPAMSGIEVLRRLKEDPQSAGIPVVIATSHVLTAAQRERLGAEAVAIVGKTSLGAANGDEAVRRALRAAGLIHAAL